MNAVSKSQSEVATLAKVEFIDLPLSAGRLGLITLDNEVAGRPSTFGPLGLASLDAALELVSAERNIAAVALVGTAEAFCVGADLGQITGVADRQGAKDFGALGHRVFSRLSDMAVPTFAFLNGPAMGGGLELSLHCTYRTVSSAAAALSLPEVYLGLIPGWGGTYLLPHLIGPARALSVIVANPLASNKRLRPSDTVDLGIADIMLDGAEFLEQSCLWAAQVVTGAIEVPRSVPASDTWQSEVDAVRKAVDAKVKGATPAPYVACDLIAAAQTRTREEGFTAENEALAALAFGQDFRASVYSFELLTKRAKRPSGAPGPALARPITKVGIIGAGLMASQLCVLFARTLKVPVVMTDLSADRAEAGLRNVLEQISTLVAKGRMGQGEATLIRTLVSASHEQSVLADADFVIEAVFEDLEVKKAVFAAAEAVVSDTCVLATNTSSLSVSDMAKDLRHPERVIGFHFFNPVAVMALLEIAPTALTDPATTATAFAAGKGLGKTCVLVQGAPCFVVNRLLVRFLCELWRVVDEGTEFEVADRAAHLMGVPMGAFELLALVGPPVAFHSAQTMVDAFPDRFYGSENMRRVVESGATAFWTRSPEGGRVIDPDVRALYEMGDTRLTAEQVRDRVADALADEAAIMLSEGVVAEPQDIDLCMLLGVGWPMSNGGLTPYLDRIGASERASGRRFLPVGVASV